MQILHAKEANNEKNRHFFTFSADCCGDAAFCGTCIDNAVKGNNKLCITKRQGN